MMIGNNARRVYIEPMVASSKKMDVRTLALLLAASNKATACLEGKNAAPTPEEMLSIGLAIGMHEASRSEKTLQPRQSLWKTAARLGI